ncbi:hypothetical protein Dtox_3415 [Desulfofarcimen acetoxidans DSM 771]|uniref:Uncharacterized protein n=1 Tax=Desulfofarcimen acetoxidans (strain ATCC 49208 / DSM 771 / KCTC 5769 / VKM B-1644 / 5575) TaxID=485916 RepID=C8W6N0_DESAS|nr:hypothetical protein [Desulfofarcimen acetoxidans]ACV64139.1 hypothetical protein Dtox_3415 [Desulfofarcimen acetoxidans DSM 771]
MKKQLQGIALILFGILVTLASDWLGHYITPDVTVPWILIGLAIGIVGVVLVFKKSKGDNK